MTAIPSTPQDRADPVGDYHVTVEYQTNAGNAGVWAGLVHASSFDEAHEKGREKCMRQRGRHILKVYGGSAHPPPREQQKDAHP